jgi:hypothetical protein
MMYDEVITEEERLVDLDCGSEGPPLFSKWTNCCPDQAEVRTRYSALAQWAY